ncbi:MAG: hypothetical protein J5760_01865, partial [Clostridia bacterium]|nr:hypothetical protein [Clostridia bacterium]
PNDPFELDFECESGGRQRLFFTGENEYNYFLKTEIGCGPLYKRIDESLVPGTDDWYSLRMVGAPYPQVAMKKLMFPPTIGMYGLIDATDDFDAGVFTAGRGIKIREGGYLRICLEIWDVIKGTARIDTRREPDRIVCFDCPEGDYSFTDVHGNVKLPLNSTACVIVYVEGEDFEGEVLFERPHVTSSNGWNILAPFEPNKVMFERDYNWLGVNLSKLEWPCARIEINGRVVFDGEFFERCHRYSEKELPIPDGVLKTGKNRVSFTVTSAYHDAPSYRLHEMGIVSEPAELITAVPETAVRGKEFALLLDIREPVKLSISGDVEVLSDLDIKEEGLYALRLRCDKLCRDLEIMVNGEKAVIKRVIDRKEDGVVIGTGDLIYVDQTEDDFRNFFKWYFSNHVGNFVTIRPTYRWSGVRKCQPELWKKYAKLFTGLGVKYAHMVDGREPQGICCQPAFKELEGPGFLGRQCHERDGAYNYWGPSTTPTDGLDINGNYNTQMLRDYFWRMFRIDNEHYGRGSGTPADIYQDGEKLYMYRHIGVPADMQAQAEAIIEAFRRIKFDNTRHTGPSIMFKYFKMAGYETASAETMDSPIEFLMAGLRGVEEGYGQKAIGVHHALQWSTVPHDWDGRYRRYRLALYVAWIQGSHQNNTEEGLWHMEERYTHHHRHDVAAKEHLKCDQDLYRYITTHSRRGRLRANVAVMYGRYDGCSCFGGKRMCIFGMMQSQANREFDAEQSWHIPRSVFHPNTVGGFFAKVQGERSKHGPIGLVSGTPYGNFNVVPVEEDYYDYPLLAYFSYNCAEKSDLDRLYEKVKDGATVLMTLAHLTVTTDRKAIENYDLEFEKHPFIDALGFDYDKKCIPGAGEIAEINLGKGRAIMFNTLLYPANERIKDAYTAKLIEETDRINAAERVFPVVDNKVHAAIYDTGKDSGDIYFIAVDWWNESEEIRKAALRLGDYEYDISLPFGVMKKVVFYGDTALVCERESGEVLSFDGKRAVVQGDGDEPFILFKDGKTIPVTVSFGDEVQKTIELYL